MDNEHIAIRRHGRREEHRYDVSPDQLDRLERSGGDIGFNFQVAQFLITIAATFLVSLLTNPPSSQTTKFVFIVFVVLGFLFGPIFGLMWLKERGAFRRIIREVRELPEIGPLGDQSKELRPAELDQLPLGSSPVPAPAVAQPIEAVPEPQPATAVPEAASAPPPRESK
jgi:hypothetical protein